MEDPASWQSAGRNGPRGSHHWGGLTGKVVTLYGSNDRPKLRL